MRIARITLILAVIFCLVGCGIKNKEKDTVTAESEETVNVPAIKECKATQESGDYSITEYDRDGNKLKVTDYDKDGKVQGTYTYTYDERGNECTYTFTGVDGKPILYRKTVYDEEGNVLEVYDGDSEEDCSLQEEYIYRDGLLFSNTFYYNDGSTNYTEYTYDENGRCTEKVHFNQDDGYVYRRWIYEYDEAGKLKKMKDISHDSVYIETYDDEERKILEEFCNADEEVHAQTEYKYNEYGLEETIRYGEDGSEQQHSRTVYNDKGLATATYSSSGGREEQMQIFYEYDDSGRLIHSKGFFTEYIAEYNEHGYLLKMHKEDYSPFRSSLPVDITEEYEYTYY